MKWMSAGLKLPRLYSIECFPSFKSLLSNFLNFSRKALSEFSKKIHWVETFSFYGDFDVL